MKTISFSIAQRRVQALTEALELWQVDHEEAQFAYDVDELTRETTSLLEPIQRIAAKFGDGLNSIADHGRLVAAHNVGWLLTQTSELFASVRSAINDATRRGYAIQGADRFVEAGREINRLRDQICESWLLPDRKTMAASKEAIAAGRYRTL